MRASAVLLLLAGALAAGCSEDETEAKGRANATAPARTGPDTRTTPSRSREQADEGRDVAWLGRLHRWETNLGNDARKVEAVGRDNGPGARRKLRRSLLDLAACERRLLRQVREPDADRYRPGYDLLLKGCQTIEHIALRLSRSMQARKTVSVAVVRRETTRSTRFFRRGSASLEHSLRANRALPMRSGSREESKIEPQLSRFASRLVVHKPSGIEVRCWSVREWPFVLKEWGAYIGKADLLGFVHGVRPRASLAPKVCRALARFVYHEERPASGLELLKMADAVRVLAHESEHIRNNRGDEAATECHAMQHMRRLAGIMGASESYADILTDRYWSELYELNLPEYRSKACHDGGRLDLRPGDETWP